MGIVVDRLSILACDWYHTREAKKMEEHESNIPTDFTTLDNFLACVGVEDREHYFKSSKELRDIYDKFTKWTREADERLKSALIEMKKVLDDKKDE